MTQAEAKLQGFYKICVTGDFGSGKSSLILRFVDGIFSDSQRITLGVDQKLKTVRIDEEEEVKISVCDTAGQERFKTITASFYRGTHGVIFMYDVTDEESFKNLLHWMEEVERYAQDTDRIIVANKVDLTDRRVVTTDAGKEFATKENIPYYEISAKTGDNVEMIFEEITRNIHYRFYGSNSSNNNKQPPPSMRRIKLHETKSKTTSEDKKKEMKKCSI